MRMLIKNELIKLFKRKSMIVMLALVLATSFLIMPIYSNGGYAYPEIGYGYDESYWWEDEAEWLEEEYGKKDAYGEYVDRTEYGYTQRNRAEMYRYMLALGMKGSRDWRYSLIEEMFSYKLTIDYKGKLSDEERSRYESLRGFVEANDWRAWYQFEKDSITALATELGSSKHSIEALTFEYSYRLENDVEPYKEPWRDQLISQAVSAKGSLVPYLEAADRGERVDDEDTERYRNDLALALYRLDNDIEHDVSADLQGNNFGAKTFWELFANSLVLTTLVGIMMIVIAGRIVAEEYSGGTVKFLLICPARREKILFSKYFTVLIVGSMMMTALYISSGIFALIYSGGEGIAAAALSVKNGVVSEVSPFLKLLGSYALQGVGMTVMATMAFAISSLMKSTSLSIGIGLFAFTSGVTGTLILQAMDIDFARYLIFANIDLAAIAAGEPMFDYQTLPIALIVIAVHMIIFLWTASDAFSRRDI